MKHKVILHTNIDDRHVNVPVVQHEIQTLNEQHRKWMLVTGRHPNRKRRRTYANILAELNSKQSPMNNRRLTLGRKSNRLLKVFNSLIPYKALRNLKALGLSLPNIFRRPKMATI